MSVDNTIKIGKINLSKIKDIMRFIQIINQQEGDYILQHNSIEVKAKSIIGIYSLDLAEDVWLIAKKAEKSEIEKLMETLKEDNLLKD